MYCLPREGKRLLVRVIGSSFKKSRVGEIEILPYFLFFVSLPRIATISVTSQALLHDIRAYFVVGKKRRKQENYLKFECT